MIDNIHNLPLYLLLEDQKGVSFMWDGRLYQTFGEEEDDCTISVFDATTGIPDVFHSDFVPKQYTLQ